LVECMLGRVVGRLNFEGSYGRERHGSVGSDILNGERKGNGLVGTNDGTAVRYIKEGIPCGDMCSEGFGVSSLCCGDWDHLDVRKLRPMPL
jgi:hypothetical protein